MASKINKVLTNQIQTLSNEELANVSASLSAILGQSGGGEQCASAWLPTVTEDGDISWTLTSATTTPATANIMGPQGLQGPQGTSGAKGADGTSVVLQSVTDVEGGKQVTLVWGETPSTSSFVIPSGTPGTDGKDGKDGTDGTNGTSVYLDSVSTVAGGTQVTLGWGTSDTSAFVIPSGAAGAPGTDGKDGTDGEDGVSPTITTTELSPTEQHPQGGFAVTITDGTGSQTINIWNGNNGAGATVRLLEGTGIKIEANGSDYTISVSADYALKSELPDVSDMATQTWVGEQGYLTSIPDTYATKAYANETSTNALSAAESWVNQQNFATSAGLAANKQFAMTTSGWKVVQGGGSTYTPGDCIDITDDVISFDGAAIDPEEQIIVGNGTTENPLSTSAFANALNLELDDINDAISDLATEIAALGGTIILRGRASCSWLNNVQAGSFQTGDAYIATDSGQIWSYDHTTGQGENINVSAGDMVVLINYNNNKEVAVLSTTPDLDTYAQKTELPIVEGGANVVVTETTMSTGAKKYTVAAIGGGGAADMSYVVNSSDQRIDVSDTYDAQTNCRTFTLSANMPKFEAVTRIPDTITPNTYYFVYEE